MGSESIVTLRVRASWRRRLSGSAASLLGVFALASAAAASPAGSAPDSTSLSLTAYAPVAATPAVSSVGTRLDLGLQVDTLQASVQAAVEGGQAPPSFGFAAPLWGQGWSGQKVQITSVWAPTPLAHLDLTLGDQLRRDLVAANLFTPGSADQAVITRSRSAGVTASLSPGAPFKVQFGAAATSSVIDTQTLAVATGPTAVSALQTDTRRAFAQLIWSPGPPLTLDFGEALETRGVAWRGAAQDAASYGYAAPHATATLTPWPQGHWSISFERAIAPLDPAQYATYVQAEGQATAGAFHPDREWRSVVSLRQTLPGAVTLSASLTQARLESVTDFGRIGQTQAPKDIGGGSREAVDVALVAPVQVPGWPLLNLNGQASWRRSQVTDPFTGDPRPLSGESPYQAQLGVSGSMKVLPVTWNLKAEITGPQSLSQISQVDTLTAAAGLGGGVDYRAGSLTLGLQVDNLVGGARTDISQHYAGDRAFSPPDGTALIHSDSRAIRFTLRKAL